MVCLILNAMGLGVSFFEKKQLMYVLFGFSTLVYYRKYAVLSWRIFYERFVGNSERVDAAITNELVSAFCLLSCYILIYQKMGKICIMFPILQALFFEVKILLNEGTREKMIVVVGLLIELIIGIMVCLQ